MLVYCFPSLLFYFKFEPHFTHPFKSFSSEVPLKGTHETYDEMMEVAPFNKAISVHFTA